MHGDVQIAQDFMREVLERVEHAVSDSVGLQEFKEGLQKIGLGTG